MCVHDKKVKMMDREWEITTYERLETFLRKLFGTQQKYLGSDMNYALRLQNTNMKKSRTAYYDDVDNVC